MSLFVEIFVTDFKNLKFLSLTHNQQEENKFVNFLIFISNHVKLNNSSNFIKQKYHNVLIKHKVILLIYFITSKINQKLE